MEPPMASLEQGHAADVHRQADLPIWGGNRQKDDGLDGLLFGVMHETDATPAKAGRRGHCHGHGEKGGDGRIRSRSATRQDVAGHQNRPGLIGGHRTGETAHASTAEIGRWRGRIALAGGQNGQSTGKSTGQCKDGKKGLRSAAKRPSSLADFNHS